MSTRPILQSHPDGTCPTALDPEPVASPSSGNSPAAPATGDILQSRADAQLTSDGFDSELILHTGKGELGNEGEIFGLSGKLSRDEFTIQGAVGRAQIEGRLGSVSAEALAFKASSGTVNPDGSVGRNLALGTTVVGIEGTLNLGANSVTGGLSAGAGVELGIGTRDLDKDNRPEFCARVSALILTVGLCIESPL
jgi:hypothetical protein